MIMLQVKTVLSMYQKHKVSVGSLTGQVLMMISMMILITIKMTAIKLFVVD